MGWWASHPIHPPMDPPMYVYVTYIGDDDCSSHVCFGAIIGNIIVAGAIIITYKTVSVNVLLRIVCVLVTFIKRSNT